MTKIDSLKSSGSYNDRHREVTLNRFNNDDFYDPSDIVQVKYEMLRGVREHDLTVEEVSKQYGMSRTAYYNAKEAFEENGVLGLIPVKRGPKGSRLDPETERCIDEYLADHPRSKTPEVCKRVLSVTGISIPVSTMRRIIKIKREQSM